jgi:hypothetical protein
MLNIVHFPKRSETRLSESCPKLGEDLLESDREGAIEGASAGVAMAASAKEFGDTGYVCFAFAADAEAKLVGVRDLSEKDRRFDPGDADEVVDDSLAVLGGCADAVHVFTGDPRPGKIVVALEIREGGAEEANLAGGVREVDVAGYLAGVRTTGGKMMDKGEGVGVGAGVGKGSGVGEDAGVEASGNGGRDLDVCSDGDVVNHGGDGACVLIDPINRGEGTAAGVVIDVDESSAFETEKTCADDAVAFEEDGGGGAGGVYIVRGGGVMDSADVGEGGVGGGDGVGEDDVGLAAELVEHLGEG